MASTLPKRPASREPEDKLSPKRRMLASSPREEGEVDDGTNGSLAKEPSKPPEPVSATGGSQNQKNKVAFPFKSKFKSSQQPIELDSLAASSSSQNHHHSSHSNHYRSERDDRPSSHPNNQRGRAHDRDTRHSDRSRSRSRSSTSSRRHASPKHRLPGSSASTLQEWSGPGKRKGDSRSWTQRDSHEDYDRLRYDRDSRNGGSYRDRSRRHDSHDRRGNQYDRYEPRDAHGRSHHRDQVPRHHGQRYEPDYHNNWHTRGDYDHSSRSYSGYQPPRRERERYPPASGDYYRPQSPPGHDRDQPSSPRHRPISPPPIRTDAEDKDYRPVSPEAMLRPRSPLPSDSLGPPQPLLSPHLQQNPVSPSIPHSELQSSRTSGLHFQLAKPATSTLLPPVPLEEQMRKSMKPPSAPVTQGLDPTSIDMLKPSPTENRPPPPPEDAPPPPPENNPPPLPPPQSLPPVPGAPNAHPSPPSMRLPKPSDLPKELPRPEGWDRTKKEEPLRPRTRQKAPKRTSKEEYTAYSRYFLGCGQQSDYEVTTKVGEGTFGEVHKAVDKNNKKAVALKRIMMHNEKEGMPVTALREIKILKALKHPCIVDLLDMFVVRSKDKEPFTVYMVFPYMDHDLAGLLENDRLKLQPSHIKLYMKQLLEGTHYMHKNHILHRDMKAANLLINNDGTLKIADFGLARAFTPSLGTSTGRPGIKDRKYTNCVVTRWYRPPELLLGARQYGGEVDMWGVGCVFGEMFLRKPILPGSSDPDQLEKIWGMCGTPNQQDWPHHDTLPTFDALRFRQTLPRKIRSFFAAMVDCEEALDLLDKMLICNPKTRITAEQALLHDWFWIDPMPAEFGTLPIYEASHEMDRRNRGAPPPGFRPPVPQGHPPNQHPNHQNHHNSGRRNGRYVPPPPLALQQAHRELQQANGNNPNFHPNNHNNHGHPPPLGAIPPPHPGGLPYNGPPSFMSGQGPRPPLLPPHGQPFPPHGHRPPGPPPPLSFGGPPLPPMPQPPSGYNGAPPLPMPPPPPSNGILPHGYPPELNPQMHGYIPPPIPDHRNQHGRRGPGGPPGPYSHQGGGGGGGGRRYNGGHGQNNHHPSGPPGPPPLSMNVDHKAVGLPPKPPGA